MAANINIWQGTKLAAGANVLANRGGAVIRGIFISSKGTSPTVIVYDNSVSTASTVIVPSFVPTGVGFVDFGGLGMGKGLMVKCASVTGTLVWQPSNSV